MTVDPSILEPYYRAAILGLRALEARSGRRRSFGEEADARWKAFRGSLDAPDRLDLLLRAAAKGNPTAFAPRTVVPLEGIAEDEPFGPEWPGCPKLLAAALVKEAGEPLAREVATPGAALRTAAKAWGLDPRPLDPRELEAVAPATRLLAAGAGAVVSLAERFSARADLDLPQQVLLVAGTPAERQLFGLAVALLGSPSPVRLLAPGEAIPDGVRVAFPTVSKVVVSADAPSALRDAAQIFAGALSSR